MEGNGLPTRFEIFILVNLLYDILTNSHKTHIILTVFFLQKGQASLYKRKLNMIDK